MNGPEAFEIILKNEPRVCAACGETSCKDCKKALAKALVERKLNTIETIGKYVDIRFERTSAGKPIMLISNRRLGQGWLIHISEEEFDSVKEAME